MTTVPLLDAERLTVRRADHLGQLRAGENHDRGPHAQVLGDGALERRGDPRGVGFLAGEDHVAALNVGRHLGVALLRPPTLIPSSRATWVGMPSSCPWLDGLALLWH